MKKIFITTAIDYTNDVIHIGHAYQKIVADCFARFYRILGWQVFFLTGTDEYGTTNEQAAKKIGKNPKAFVDEISQKNKEQLLSLKISFDRFIRTTDTDHRRVVSDFYLTAFKNGDIYQGEYQGLYCEGCEAYKTLTELTDDKKCPLHPTREIKKIKETNYFFRWSKYKNFLEDYFLNHPQFIIPEIKKAEMVAFLKKGLNDLPISRPKFKVSWGIPVPNDPSQNIYVWFDALINYFTAGSQKGFWDQKTEIVHILGKDNLRWHALLWPAMLKSAGFRLPDHILTHSFISINGKKISKSLGNVIRPSELVSQFGADATRYFFLKYGPANDDVDISIEKIKKVYNSELANDWGNLVSRVAKLAEISNLKCQISNLNFSPNVKKSLMKFNIIQAINDISQRIVKLNQYINENKPWEKKSQELGKILTYAVSQIRQIAFDLQPFMPESSEKILKQFSNKKIKSKQPYFPRLNL